MAKKTAYLACDTAYEHGVVTLFTEDEIIFSELLSEKMAHGKHICGAIERALTVALHHDLEIHGVFCGLGPGSFVGVRVALATVLGFSFARGLPVMGFCSHEAIAYSFLPGENLAIYMKASGDLGYLTRYVIKDQRRWQKISCEVIAITDVAASLGSHELVCSDQSETLTRHLHRPVTLVNGPTAAGIKQAALCRLNQTGAFVDESASIKPNYVKAPNVSTPKRAIVIDHPTH